jgi:hypothetical protein
MIEGDIQYCYRLMLDALCEHFVWTVENRDDIFGQPLNRLASPKPTAKSRGG